MAFKTFEVPEIGIVTVYKRRGSRSLRLSVQSDGSLRVTIPAWSAYATGVSFARSRAEWISKHTATRSVSQLQDGQAIGKSHHLIFVRDATASKVSTRLKDTEVVVRLPIDTSSTTPVAQKAAQTAAIRALRQQAEALLPPRLKVLADRYGFEYKSVGVKQLKSRWGSCDSHRNITLNLFLMQVPWELIDYVLLHELTHTEVMQHGPKFWAAMERVLPKAKRLRTELHKHRTVLE